MQWMFKVPSMLVEILEGFSFFFKSSYPGESYPDFDLSKVPQILFK